ncbi:MAG: hypothetical protein ACRECH_05105 [Nitrososphaerales archaeon]
MSVRRRPLTVPERSKAPYIEPEWKTNAPYIEPEWNEAPYIEPEWRTAPYIEPEWETYGGFGRMVVVDSGSHGPAIQTLW